MKSKIEYFVFEQNEPSETALERYHKLVYEMLMKDDKRIGYEEKKVSNNMN